ncbi:MAG: disulfide oxidoreductase [Gemmatimonadota bacterium]|nr:disulfide oxidoreductase [Gemmatimonadota bacterium]
MRTYAAVAQALGFLTLLALGVAALLTVALAVPSGRARIGGLLLGREGDAVGFAWLASLIAMGGSLYFSDIVGFAPCLLCWYQRIAMYPLVAVLGVALLRSDPAVWRFALPLSLIGLVISAYHVLIQFRPALEVTSCGAGAPCSGRYVAVFGFVSIPWMAGGAFLFISTLLLALCQSERITRGPPLVGDEEAAEG